MSYEVEHLNEEINGKGKKVIDFKVDYNDEGEPMTSEDDDDDEDMTLLTKDSKA